MAASRFVRFHRGRTLARLHSDQRGAVSLETVLILGAVAIPVLIFILKYGWPYIRDSFTDRQQLLEIESDRTINNG